MVFRLVGPSSTLPNSQCTWPHAPARLCCCLWCCHKLGGAIHAACMLAGADCGNLLTYICTAVGSSKPDICYEAQQFKRCPGAPTS